jgi:beta-N-acetylhexosaminidase
VTLGGVSRPGQLLFAGFPGLEVPPDLAERIREGRIGGVVLFSRNVGSPEALRSLIAELHALAPSDAPLTVAVDQEGGRVQRLRSPWTEWPPMRALGDRSPEETAAFARALAVEVAAAGFDLDFAPCVDVDSNADNPVIGDRSFARDPQLVSAHVAAFVRAFQAAGIGACAKHFPGHGDTTVDSHLDLPRLDHDLDRLREVELPPFRAAIEAGVASVMTAHVLFTRLDTERPATLSPTVMRLLREELAYDGLVFSDDIEMRAVADRFSVDECSLGALEAGVDALLVCSRADLREEVLSRLERAPERLLEAPLRRMAAFKAELADRRAAAVAPEPMGPPFPEHVLLAQRLAGRATQSGVFADPTERA